MMILWIFFPLSSISGWCSADGPSVRLLGICIEYRLFSENISGCTSDVKRGEIVSKLCKICIRILDFFHVHSGQKFYADSS